MKNFTSLNISTIIFGALSILLFCNLNGLLKNLFLINAALSPLILLFSLLLLGLIKFKKSYFTKPIVFFLLTLISLYFIGIFSGLFYYGQTNFAYSGLFTATRELLTSLIIFIVFSCFIASLTPKGKTKTIKFILSLFLVTSLFGVLESIFGFRPVAVTAAYDTERTLGFFGNPNLTGLQANFTLSLILGLFVGRITSLSFTLIAIPIALYASLSSFSKMAIITSALLLILFLLFCFRNSLSLNDKKRSLPSLMLLLIIFFTSVFIIIPVSKKYYDELGTGQQKRLTGIFKLVVEGEVNRKTTSMRSAIFKDGIDIIKKNPIIGHGLTTFSIGGMFKSSRTHGVHNTYLKLIGEAGFIPLLFFLLFGLSLAIKVVHLQDQVSVAAIFVLISFFLYALSSHNTLQDKFAVALLASLCGYYSQRRNSSATTTK